MLTSALATALLVVSATAGAKPQQNVHVQDWETTVTDDGAGSLTFRAMTLEETKPREDTLVLALDRLPNQCDTVLISMAVVGQETHGLPGGMLSPNFLGVMQVDQRKPRHFDYRFLTDPHFDNVILVQLTRWDGDNNLLDEVRKGNKWQFRFNVDGEEHSWRFSLKGVTSVLEQTYKQCVAKREEPPAETPLEQASLADEYAL
jgi:hypothetical protein